MKIWKWHCNFIVTKEPIPKEKLAALKDGKAHLRKNPVRKRPETTAKTPQESEQEAKI